MYSSVWKKYREAITYIIVGILTTIVYFVTRFSVHIVIDNSVICVVLAQIASIIFAFIFNKIWVFREHVNGIEELFIQFVKFCMGRGFVFILDIGITYFCVDLGGDFFVGLLQLERINYQEGIFLFAQKYIGTPALLIEFLFALLTQILSVVLNYVFSKLFVFRKK